MPLWNPYTSGGLPIGTLPMYGLLYPLNILFFVLPFNQALGYHAALRLLVAGIGFVAGGFLGRVKGNGVKKQ